MYEYENGEKKMNVGYVRVEISNGQCKFTIRMQLKGLLDGIFPTYLIHRPQDELDLVYLGDCSVKNQVMDSRLISNKENVMDSGKDFSEMGGILLFLNSEVFYATQWDDKPVDHKEVLEALRPKSKLEAPPIDLSSHIDNQQEFMTVHEDENINKSAQISEKQDKLMEDMASKNIMATDKIPVDKRNEGEKSIDEKTMDDKHVNKEELDEKPIENKDGDINSPVYMLPRGWKYREPIPDSKMSAVNPWDLVEKYEKQKSIINSADNKRAKEITAAEQSKAEQSKAEQSKTEQSKTEQSNAEKSKAEQSKTEKNMTEQSRERRVGRDMGTSQNQPQDESSMITKIFTSFPRIYPFEDNEIRRCVKIEPKDIGSLPSETWILSNNSFLLHGYYCYHHLIFAEVVDRFGSHYILGVPGIYHNREQFMARMFGFERFKSIRKRDLRQGDFGYWYLRVNI